jgi:iron complex outermembrane receptor protein
MQIKGTGLYRVLMASAAVAAITVVQSAYAQDAATSSATTLERLTVEGGKGGKPSEGEATGPVDGYVPKATGTGSKTATPVSEIPQSVSVIGRKELDDRGVVTKIDEALRYTAGVRPSPSATTRIPTGSIFVASTRRRPASSSMVSTSIPTALAASRRMPTCWSVSRS